MRLLLIVVPGRQRSALVGDLSRFAPDAFWTIEDLRTGPRADALADALA